MKKFLALSLAATMLLSMASCGSSDTGSSTGGTDAGTSTPSADAGSTDTAGSEGSEGGEATGLEGMNVTFIPKLTGNAFFEAANDGAQSYAGGWGIDVDYQGSASAAVADQVSVINNAIASGTDAICISSVDSTGLDSALKDAIAAGTSVVTWDSDVSVDARSLMVSQGTPDILGEMLVNMSVDALTNRGVDVDNDEVKYTWHYSQATVADQNSWQVAGEAYIAANYPNWVNIAPSSYFSEQDAEKAVSIGASILEANPDIDLIICNDSTALPGQLKAAQNANMTTEDITITGFASPMSIKGYCEAGVIERWGLWDCGVQGAIGCYLAAYLAAGNTVAVGDTIDIPSIGTVEILPNDSLEPGASTPDTNSGVVLLPEQVVFTADNMNDYNF